MTGGAYVEQKVFSHMAENPSIIANGVECKKSPSQLSRCLKLLTNIYLLTSLPFHASFSYIKLQKNLKLFGKFELKFEIWRGVGGFMCFVVKEADLFIHIYFVTNYRKSLHWSRGPLKLSSHLSEMRFSSRTIFLSLLY